LLVDNTTLIQQSLTLIYENWMADVVRRFDVVA
jgi:hypothetical protein